MKIFKPELKNKNCEHDWRVLKIESKLNGFLSSDSLYFEYLYCPKCGSTQGEEIKL